MGNIEGLDDISIRIDELFFSLEKQDGFKNSEGKLNGVIYDLYSKTRRAFKTINHILKSDIRNNYLDTLPLLRIILESYLHTDYIRLNMDKIEEIQIEYENHLAFQQWRLGRTLNDLKKRSHEEIHSDYDNYINNYFKGKPIQRKVEHLESMYQLAVKVKKFPLYCEVYTILSSFVHYNPQTRGMYGSFVDDSFTFNKYEYDEELDEKIRSFVIDLTLGVIRNTSLYFQLTEFTHGDFAKVEVDWRRIINYMF